MLGKTGAAAWAGPSGSVGPGLEPVHPLPEPFTPEDFVHSVQPATLLIRMGVNIRALDRVSTRMATGWRRWGCRLLLAAAFLPMVAADSSPPASQAPVQSEETRAMIERIARIRESADPRSMAYLSDRLVEMLQQEAAKATNAQQEARLRYTLGLQMLNAGQSEESFAQLRTAEDILSRQGIKLGAQSVAELRLHKAMALLRLGEQENCQLNHTAQSCLFPIEPAGYHQLPRGSRGAVALFTEHLQSYPDDPGARWLLNIAYMTLGEWPDRVPARWLIPPKVFASEYDLPRFTDIAGNVGLDVDDLAGGTITDDFDNDGFIDIVASSWSLTGQLRLFHNDGNGRFTERTAAAGLTGIVSGLNIQQTDYNNDGWLDIWVPRGAWLGAAGRIPNSLLRNNGDGTFSDVTVEAGLLSEHPTQATVWFDFDGDGWLDLFVGNESGDPSHPDPSQLYRNNRDGTFTECADTTGIRVRRFVKGVASGDYNQDGRPDLFISCLDGPNLLLRNDGPADNGRWAFSDVSRQAGVGDRVISFPTWFFDYDNDGWDDLFVSGYNIRGVADVAADYLGLPHQAALPKLYRNNGDGTFSDVTVAARLNRVCHTMGCNFGDLDNDGWLDFYVGTGNPDLTTLIPNRMFRNAEGRFFQEVTTAGGFGHLQKGHGIAFVDLDHDGDQDIYAVMGGAFTGDNYRNALFLNPGTTNRWVKFKLEGTRSNRAAIGARLKVTLATPQGAREIYKTVNSGGSFGSSSLRQELGLGNATAITQVEVYWPASGIRQRFTDLEPNRAYHIREDRTNAVVQTLASFAFDTRPHAEHSHGSPAKP